MMYMTEESAPGIRPALAPMAFVGLILALAGVLYLGVLPGDLLKLASDSAALIR